MKIYEKIFEFKHSGKVIMDNENIMDMEYEHHDKRRNKYGQDYIIFNSKYFYFPKCVFGAFLTSDIEKTYGLVGAFIDEYKKDGFVK